MPSCMEEETHIEVKEAAEMQQKLSWAKIFFFCLNHDDNYCMKNFYLCINLNQHDSYQNCKN